MRILLELTDEPDGTTTTVFHTEGEEADCSGALAIKHLIIDLLNSINEEKDDITYH